MCDIHWSDTIYIYRFLYLYIWSISIFIDTTYKYTNIYIYLYVYTHAHGPSIVWHPLKKTKVRPGSFCLEACLRFFCGFFQEFALEAPSVAVLLAAHHLALLTRHLRRWASIRQVFGRGWVIEVMKSQGPWLFGLHVGLYYPVIWGLW